MSNEFEAVVRNGVTVSPELQKIWAVELDLLQKLKAVLEKHHLSYFASGGTLLGAVRHKGFIPWDDDIDIMMHREDYEKLLEVAPLEFHEPYFFQTAYTDKGYFRGHAQLRNSNTTGILSCEGLKVPFNQGIFIDIFPMDAIPDEKEAAERQRQRLHSINRILNNGARKPCEPLSLFSRIKRAAVGIISVFYPPLSQYKKMEKLCRAYNGQSTQRIGLLSFDPNNPRFQWDRQYFNRCVQLTFENTSISAPEKWHEVLAHQFGEYMVMQREPSYHGSALFDTEMPYKDYLAKMKQEKQQ